MFMSYSKCSNEEEGKMPAGAIIGIILILFAVIAAANVKIIPQARASIIERLGKFYATWQTGIHFKIPIIDHMSPLVSLKEQVVDFDPQPVITKDNVTMQIDTVVYFQITDPKLFVYGVEHPMQAIENLTATTLRNIVGDLELDQTLTSRDTINTQMRVILDEATDPWGIKVNRVELKSIIPPREIQDAMEKQMKAERERREAILRAEGEKRSAILVAEGQKEALILKAEGENRSAILRADAARETKIREADGEAEAILKIQEATAAGIVKINKANPSEKAVLLKSYETLARVADGKATKLVIPSDIQSLASLTSVVKEIVGDRPDS